MGHTLRVYQRDNLTIKSFLGISSPSSPHFFDSRSEKSEFRILNELHFTYDRSKHKALFENGELVKIEKNSRTGFQDITEDTEEELKEVIIQTFKEKSKK